MVTTNSPLRAVHEVLEAMKTTCPHCSVHIDIDPETHAALQGQTYFQCPGCNGLVAVPPMSAASPQAASPAPAPTLAQAHRGLNRNLLILGSAALLVLGILGVFLASRQRADTVTHITNVNREIIHNSYFQNLIASGTTTQKELEAMAVIRPFEDGFIGVSLTNLAWDDAVSLAGRVGAGLLDFGKVDYTKRNPILDWLGDNLAKHLVVPVWVQERGQPRILDGTEILSSSVLERERKAIVHWRVGQRLPTDLQSGLILHLTFDGGSPDANIRDSSGHGHHGKASGARWIPDGRRGGAYEFSKDGDEIVVPSHPTLNPSTLTLSAWIKTAAADGEWRRVFDKYWTGGFAMAIAGDSLLGEMPPLRRGRACFGCRSRPAPGYNFVETSDKIPQGEWHHVVATFDGVEQRIFLDGRLQGDRLVASDFEELIANEHDLVVGCNRSTPPDELGMSFRGIIDEPMMWNRALSPEEVRLLFESFP